MLGCRGSERGTARPEVLQSLLATTDRVVQEIDSVEYGLTDIQVGLAGTQGNGLGFRVFYPKVLATTDRVVQEIDSVEYGLTDIQVGAFRSTPARCDF